MNENNNNDNNSLDLSDNEEINEERKQNSLKDAQASSIQPQKKLSKNKNKNKKSHAFYYIFYLSIIVFIYVLLFINYLKTNNWYEENTHYINLKPISICENYIKGFQNCLNISQKSTSLIKKDGDKYIYDTKIICKEFNDKLQNCLDSVHSFNQRCQLYLNELYLCKIKKGKNINDCLNNDLINCWRIFNLINITKVYEEL